MTILETIVELLRLHGVDGSSFDRIDVALDALYKVEMNEKKPTAVEASAVEKRAPKKKVATEEHVGI